MWKYLCRRLKATGVLIAAGLLAGSAAPAWAQGMSGLGGGGGSGNSLGGVGSSSSGSSTGNSSGVGVTKGLGSGNISTLLNSNGLSSLTAIAGVSSTTGSIPAQSDPLNTFYNNPYSLGIVGTGSNPAFGQPVNAIVALPTATSTVQSSKAATTAAGFTSVGQRRTPSYITTVSDDLPLVKHLPGKLQSQLEQMLARTSALKSSAITVTVGPGDVAVLSGRVATASERRLAEGLIWTTPGVQGVQNNLQIGQ